MAMTEADIKVVIAAELKKAGFVKAEKVTKDLTKSFQKLGATIGVALSARAFINFAKQGAIAFAAEEKAVKQLTNSLANLGFAFSVPSIERYLENVEKATMVSKDELRPAMVQLISTTMNAQKSMELLGTAMDIAAETGASIAQVTTALSRAYNGNYTSLAKLSRGYTSAQLEAAGFDMTVQMLNDRFSGSAAAATDSYSFKIAQLQKAVGDAQKEIGKGLIKGLEQLGSGDYDEGLQDLVDFGNAIGKSFGYAAGAVNTLKQAYDLITLRPVRDITANLLGRNQQNQQRGGTVTPTQFELAKAAVERRKEKAIRDAEKRDREKLRKLSEKERRAREAALKKEQQLKRAGTVFDMDNIQVVAAMQGRVDAEQRLRLTALLALQTGNAEAAEKLSTAILALNAPALANLGVMIKAGDTIDDVVKKIITSQSKIALLGMGITNLPKAKNPFSDWDDILDRLLSKIGQIRSAINGFDPTAPGNPSDAAKPVIVQPNPTDPNSVITSTIPNPFETFDVGGSTIIANSGTVLTGRPDDMPNEAAARQRIADIFETIGRLGAGGVGSNITVNVAGTVISDRDLQEAVVEGLYEVQRRGQGITLSAVGL